MNNHVMTLVSTAPDGVEEWHCPSCGRRFLMEWPPHYHRVILAAGDETVSHTISKVGLPGLAMDVDALSASERQRGVALDPEIWNW